MRNSRFVPTPPRLYHLFQPQPFPRSKPAIPLTARRLWRVIRISSQVSGPHACIGCSNVRTHVCRAPYESPTAAEHVGCLSLYSRRLPAGVLPPSLRHYGSRGTLGTKKSHTKTFELPFPPSYLVSGYRGISTICPISKPIRLDPSSEHVGRPDVEYRPFFGEEGGKTEEGDDER